ncbi:MAG: magnesium/cobalt transporter CorA [Phyllobacteriaceae bacterium]|nr:magnesium/cobalt transporter CorA [Phyllobacteriaceae bacterium]
MDAHAALSVKPGFRLFVYDAAQLDERHNATLADIEVAFAGKKRLWIDHSGPLSEADVQALAAILGLNPFELIEAQEPEQRAAVVAAEGATRITATMAEGTTSFEPDQLAMFFNARMLLTLQHTPGDCMEPVRARLRNSQSRVRANGPDYLVHALLEAAIDAFYKPVDRLGDTLDALEEAISIAPQPSQMRGLHSAKRELLALKRALWPMREVLLALSLDDAAHVKPATRRAFRATQTYAIQLIEIVENDRELAANILDLYQSALANRMNEIMKVLAIISTIFIPLSFLAGVWGMNFEHMPELRAPWGYPAALGLMAAVAAALLIWFKSRKWF